ncbi:ABC transporter substrate-binding protein [Ignavigranum ruoffiae]|uniref:ABC transporter substrate-binding protein n=1 Tax=Ignavigranum ruoffiae TaxID=89093 RepID=UPI002065F332|nr:ABC transporter substrate-binding protein [Ignavigranum ruoffiae]UPQ86131.1 ABC transporter substrate-binding protein [Ignavigranum ruoffiae]
MKLMKKLRNVLIIGLLTLLVLPTQLNLSAGAKEDLHDFNLMLDWYPNANHIPIYVALAEGYFEEEGLNLTISMPAEVDDPIKLAGAGQTDLAISYPAVLIQAVAEDVPVKAVASLVQGRLDAIIYKQESGIQSPKDLAGKRIGYSTTTISENIVEAMMTYDGANYEDTQMVNVGWDLIPALATDKVDALIGAYLNHEYLLLQAEGYQMDYFDFADYGVPDADELIFVAGDRAIENKPEDIQAFMRALRRGFQTAIDDPDQALQTILDKQENAYVLDPEIEQASWERLQEDMVKKADFGQINPDLYQAFADFLYQHGSIQRALKAEDLVKLLDEE